MFENEKWSFPTSLDRNTISSRLYDASTDVGSYGDGGSLYGIHYACYSLMGRTYLVGWRYTFTWFSGTRVRAYFWCRMDLMEDEQKHMVVFDFGRPMLQRFVLSACAWVPFVFCIIVPNTLFLGHSGLLFIITGIVGVIISSSAPYIQSSLDRQSLLEWAIAVLDLQRHSRAATPSVKVGESVGHTESVKPPAEDDFHPDVGAAMANDYEYPIRRYIGISIVIGLGFWGLSSALEPAMPYLIRCVPPHWEEGWGRSMVADSPQEINDPVISATLTKIGQRLLEAVPEQPYHFEFHMRRSRIINAYAAPGGQIVILSGLASAMHDPDELEGVMAHEIQHVLNRHSLQELARDRILHIVGRAAFEYTRVNAGIGQNLLSLKFSRREESEADHKGIEMQDAAGLDPSGLLHFFQRLRQPSNALAGFLSTHPLDDRRISDIELLLLKFRGHPIKSLDVDWKDFSERARAETQKAPIDDDTVP